MSTPVKSEDHAAIHETLMETLHKATKNISFDLPQLIDEAIRKKIWITLGYASFADYALCKTSGLGITTNLQLWLLKTCLAHKHLKEWSDVLWQVEQNVRVYARANKRKIRDFNGNSLETLANEVSSLGHISYLPSRQKGRDRDLIIVRQRDPVLHEAVVTGHIALADAVKAGPTQKPRRRLASLQRDWAWATDAERTAFLLWLRRYGLTTLDEPEILAFCTADA